MRSFNLDVVNTHALKLAGISRDTPDPEGGRIERDANGEPNGLFRAAAKPLMRRHLPQTTVEDLKDGLRKAFPRMHSFGITSVIEPGLYPDEIRAYQSLRQSGELAIRANIMPNWYGFRDDEGVAQWECRAREFGFFSGLGDEWLRLGALKMALDGGINPRTATMYEPFEGEMECAEYHRLDVEALPDNFRTAQSLGWDVGVHCCGDKAQDLALQALVGAVTGLPRDDARHNIIHGNLPSPYALAQMAQHCIAVVVQPCFIYWTGDSILQDIGEHRAQNYKPMRKYLDHGVTTIASSDVTSIPSGNPFVGLYSAVTRKTRTGAEVAPQEALSRAEALRAYTVAGTWLTREEDLKGSLEVGKVADLAVLDRDYFSVPEAEIMDIQVDMTVLNGDIVYER
jgi:predicted amidohydrolase YtcJ